MQQRSVGKVIPEERLAAIQAITLAETKIPRMTLLATQAQMASLWAYRGNRSIMEMRNTLYCLASEPITALELRTVNGVCAPQLQYKFGQIFDTLSGDKGTAGGADTKTARVAVEDYFRAETVEQYPIWKLCLFLCCRIRQPGMRLEDHLDSRESLENFLEKPLYCLVGGADDSNIVVNKLRQHMQRLEREAGLER